jgi:acetolactate synthase-1/2/3 large subunit
MTAPAAVPDPNAPLSSRELTQVAAVEVALELEIEPSGHLAPATRDAELTRVRASLPKSMTGAEAVVRTLELLGVRDIFGLPGGAVLPLYDALLDSSLIRHILVRHEQGAGHAAEGYASVSGEVGVALATSGPGATNLVTAIADAHMDSVPVLFITGQVASHLLGTDAFQEADIIGATLPFVKHSVSVRRAEDIPAAIATAYFIANDGRPGPVLVDITKDAQQAPVELTWPIPLDLSGYEAEGAEVDEADIAAAVELIRQAERPVLYLGGGIVRANASEEITALTDMLYMPAVTTLMARGVLPDAHVCNLGMPGMHGTVPAVLALQEADLLIAIGSRFDDRVTGVAKLFAPDAKVIHMDVDPAEIGKIRAAQVGIVADAKVGILALHAALEAHAHEVHARMLPWWAKLSVYRKQFPLGYNRTSDGLLAPQHVIHRLGELTGPEGVYVAGVGQHQMWSAQFIRYERPRAWLNSGGAGTMGYAVPAAMGAKVAEPERTVWAIDGDGCFQMTNQELATCVLNHIPIKIAVINNSSLGMVRQWQTLFYDGRYSSTHLNTGHGSVRVPDFVKMADAYGMAARLVESEDQVDEAIRWALAYNEGPVLLEFVVSADAMVWPMVPQGVSNSAVQYALEHTPNLQADSE